MLRWNTATRTHRLTHSYTHTQRQMLTHSHSHTRSRSLTKSRGRRMHRCEPNRQKGDAKGAEQEEPKSKSKQCRAVCLGSKLEKTKRNVTKAKKRRKPELSGTFGGWVGRVSIREIQKGIDICRWAGRLSLSRAWWSCGWKLKLLECCWKAQAKN